MEDEKLNEILDSVYNDLELIGEIYPFLTYFAVKSLRKAIERELKQKGEKSLRKSIERELKQKGEINS